MLTPKQVRIFSVFARKPFAELTRREIKLLAKQNSNNALSAALRKFSEEKLVTEKKVGRSSLFAVNFENDRTGHYLALEQSLPKLAERSITHIKEEIEKTTRFYALVAFGSHAVGEQKDGSDLDVAIFIETPEKRKHLEAALNAASLKSVIPIDGFVITREDFLEMLTNDEENLGKEIARKHKALHNPHIFYGLVKEGIRRGFRI